MSFARADTWPSYEVQHWPCDHCAVTGICPTTCPLRIVYPQASPQSSSSGSSSFFTLVFFAATALLVPTAALLTLVLALGLLAVTTGVFFTSPFGNAPLPFDLAAACAFSQPSKSGSPPSS